VKQSERRMTSQRKAVLEAVIAHGNHPTADDVFYLVKRRLPGISLSTVYRNLGVLAEQGEISAVRGPCSELHYDHNAHHHGHVYCEVCGSVTDVEFCAGDLSVLASLVDSGYLIGTLYLTGICAGCAGSEGKEKR
jgi:Fur family ferric uptake transcriptional regulator